MKRKMGWMVLCVGLLVLSSRFLFGQERWVYLYDNPGDGGGEAWSVVTGPSSNLCAAGLTHVGSHNDFTVVGLTASGVGQWVYKYNGPGNAGDGAYSIVIGSNGDLYAAGFSTGVGSYGDFTVASLSDSGKERWVYQYNGPGNYSDVANSIVMGSDGNLYAAGYSCGTGTHYDFTVVSLTDSGEERWVYRYNGSADTADVAYCIVTGPDGNLYAAGYACGSASHYDFTVVSLTDSGVERWVYRYNGPGNYSDVAYSIVMGPDGNLYAAGKSSGSGTLDDFTVVSLTDSGVERWVYRYNGPGDKADVANSIVTGSDGNLYVAGWSWGSMTGTDFTVVSLTDSGVERWVYLYDGPGNYWDEANSIAMGLDGNLYAAGSSWGNETWNDFTVVSLTDSGTERWVYRYDGPVGWNDEANTVVMGSDGNLYAAGWCLVERAGADTCPDFTVVGLTADVGVEEELNRLPVHDCRLLQNEPNPFRVSSSIKYSLSTRCDVNLNLYDVTGRLVETLVNETQQPGIHQVRWDRKNSPSGVYFYRLSAREFVETRKMVVLE